MLIEFYFKKYVELFYWLGNHWLLYVDHGFGYLLLLKHVSVPSASTSNLIIAKSMCLNHLNIYIGRPNTDFSS
jgi:hypothetical protein